MNKTHHPGPVRRAALRLWMLAPVCLGMLVAACAGGGNTPEKPSLTAAPAPVGQTLVVRKNIKALTAQERADFVEALLRLKKMPAPDEDEVGNWYDHFVAAHMRKLVCWTDEPGQGGYGHNGPDILTWHRAFLRDFEKAMSQAMGKPMALPYWDWTDPSSLAVLFSDDFMGGKGDPAQGYRVTSGPFKEGSIWRLNVKGFVSTNPGRFDWLVRAVATMPGMTQLPSAEEVQQALLRPVYDTAPWNVRANLDRSFRAFVDGSYDAVGVKCDGGIIALDDAKTALVHGTVHMWAGGVDAQGNPGSLTDTATSPNDPIFWLHHSNVDRLLESWWVKHDYQYLPVSGGPRGANLNDHMWPFSQTNGDMAVPTARLGYTYDQLIPIDTRTKLIPVAKWVEMRGAYALCSPTQTPTQTALLPAAQGAAQATAQDKPISAASFIPPLRIALPASQKQAGSAAANPT